MLFCRQTKPFLREYIAAFWGERDTPSVPLDLGPDDDTPIGGIVRCWQTDLFVSRVGGDVKGADIRMSTTQEETHMKERESKALAEFVKITKVGQTIAGKVIRWSAGTEGNSPFVVFEPVFLREEVGGKWSRYGTAAFGLSTDLARKVDPKDVNKWLLFQFHDTEATSKGGMKKLFKVFELEQNEVAALMDKASSGGDAPAFAASEREPGEEEEGVI